MKSFMHLMIILFCTVFSIIVHGQNSKTDTEIALFLKDNGNLSTLHYPKSVIRFYTQNNFEYAWVNVEQKSDQPEIAMLLLEYSYRSGLSLSDYHWGAISLRKLRELRNTPAEINQKEKAVFDIVMTDAFITYINHLHFGKYNPSYNASYIDTNYIDGFRSDDVLLYASNCSITMKEL
ncbi:MAG: hypothetical protein MUW56_20365 [Chryseobacterium sp.]|uniref:hypothetical protein n=1 Tax=Chryseobacterium sp. TaxID=1871047 RepID=UPI0025BCA42A|nr:hypothetical protein [Chryseobacterium sp.]MCJ7935913.1 hypothetical protein [Chryseobacterium sp.]